MTCGIDFIIIWHCLCIVCCTPVCTLAYPNQHVHVHVCWHATNWITGIANHQLQCWAGMQQLLEDKGQLLLFSTSVSIIHRLSFTPSLSLLRSMTGSQYISQLPSRSLATDEWMAQWPSLDDWLGRSSASQIHVQPPTLIRWVPGTTRGPLQRWSTLNYGSSSRCVCVYVCAHVSEWVSVWGGGAFVAAAGSMIILVSAAVKV